MLFGNPDSYAVCFERVAAWSSGNFDEGFLFYMTGSEIIGEKIKFSTLGVDMYRLGFCIQRVQAQEIDLRLSELPTAEAYEELYNRTCAIGYEENDYSYYISSESQSDASENVFLLKTPHDFDRLLYGSGRDGNQAREVRIPKGEVLATLKEAVDGFEKIRTRRS